MMLSKNNNGSDNGLLMNGAGAGAGANGFPYANVPGLGSYSQAGLAAFFNPMVALNAAAALNNPLNNPMQHLMSNLLNNLIKQDPQSAGNCYNIE